MTSSATPRAALLSAFGCYVIWGFMPLLFMGRHAVGFDALEILAPTLQFAVGVWAGEALTPLRVLSFAFIWGGAGVFAAAALFRHRAAREALKRYAEPV